MRPEASSRPRLPAAVPLRADLDGQTRTNHRPGLGSAGAVYLLYKDGTNCVATVKSTSIGSASATSAFLEVEGSARTTGSGSFGYYAGPVTKAAPDRCVRWGASVGSSSYTRPVRAGGRASPSRHTSWGAAG